MECHYHQGRESTDNCAICGKPICKECGLEISGNTYCKDCLEKIVGTGLGNIKNETPSQEYEEPNIHEPPKEEYVKTPSLEQKEEANFEIDNQEEYIPKEDIYTTPEAQYTSEKESEYVKPQETYIPPQEEDFIYPDHDYQPETRSGIKNLEDKYERYLDELYDDSDISLSEQLARDEEKYGSLTTKPYEVQNDESNYYHDPPQESYYKEYTENIDEAMNNFDTQGSKPLIKTNSTSKHNIYYKNDEENEPRTKLDIILTITFVILLIVVILYIIFLLLLSNVYPTFNDAIFGLFS